MEKNLANIVWHATDDLKFKKQIIHFEFICDHYYHFKKLYKLFLPFA